MTEPTIQCEECKRNIPRSKKLSINKTVWSPKSGDISKDIFVCFSCYRKDKLKEIKLSQAMTIVFIILGIFTFIIKDELIFLSGANDPNLIGLPATEEPYLLVTLVFFLIAFFFFFVRRRFVEKLKQLRILYDF